MKFLKVISVTEAHELIRAHFGGAPPKTVKVGIDGALSLTAAADCRSGEDIPGFDRSTVDGFAVVASDTFGAGEAIPSLHTVAGRVEMGVMPDAAVTAGTAVYVPTGGALPSGADAVVMTEDTDIIKGHNDNGGVLAVRSPCAPGANIIYKGDDIKKGQRLVGAGKVVTPLDIGVLAAAGIAEIEVCKPLDFFLISTGDEIVEIDDPQASQPGSIRDINGHIISALLKKSGQNVIKRVIVPDRFDGIRNAVEEGLRLCDAVIISGGSSAGDKDYAPAVIDSFNDTGVFIHGLAVKPGKPTAVGKVRGKPVFGLPGHPASAVIAYGLTVDFYIRMMQNRSAGGNAVRAKMGANVHSSPGKLTCQTVRLINEGGGLTAIPVHGKSGLITLLANADGYVEIPENIEGLNKGEYVEVKIIN